MVRPVLPMKFQFQVALSAALVAEPGKSHLKNWGNLGLGMVDFPIVVDIFKKIISCFQEDIGPTFKIFEICLDGSLKS